MHSFMNTFYHLIINIIILRGNRGKVILPFLLLTPTKKNGFFTSFRLRRGDYPMNGMDVKKINRNCFHIPGQSDISARRFFCLIRAIT